MSSPTVAFFCMSLLGHFRRCRALIEALARAGVDVVVFSDAAFEGEARAAGARFVDLFEDRPMAAADDSSLPASCRCVTFAGRFGDEVIELVDRYQPQLVIADSFAVVGRVVATALTIPYVNVCSGHNVTAASVVPIMATKPSVRISDACLRAVETLRDRFGLDDASPFVHLGSLSPVLNVYCEPPEFLTPAERAAFEPVMFFGSLPFDHRAADTAEGERRFPDEAGERIYVSFGTLVCQNFTAEAIAALTAIATVIAEDPGTYGLISLGGASVDPADVRQLARPNVRVEPFVDQWRVLSEADAFVTHHGLNSTHESIFHGVPMVSYPFEWDQPGMAERCQTLDLAVGLARELRSPIDVDHVRTAFARVRADRSRLEAGLTAARAWEDDVVSNRAVVVHRIAELADG